jgi:hypothetical protein
MSPTSEQIQWRWGSRQELRAFIETLEEGALIQVEHAHPAVFTDDPMDPGDDLCRYRQMPHEFGAHKFIMGMWRQACEIDRLPTID